MLAAVGHKCRVTRIWRGGRRGSLIRAGLSGRQNARVDSDTWQEFERKFKCSVLYLEAVIYTLPFAVLYLNQSASATHHNGMCFFYYFFFLVYLCIRQKLESGLFRPDCCSPYRWKQTESGRFPSTQRLCGQPGCIRARQLPLMRPWCVSPQPLLVRQVTADSERIKAF